jgi:hypothetical protein
MRERADRLLLATLLGTLSAVVVALRAARTIYELAAGDET